MIHGSRTLSGALVVGVLIGIGGGVYRLQTHSGNEDRPPYAAATVLPADAKKSGRSYSAEGLVTEIAGIKSAELRDHLTQIYVASEYKLLWSDSKAAMRRLAAADDFLAILVAHGVNPAPLEAATTHVRTAHTYDEAIVADVRMTATLLRLTEGQRLGFVPAKELGSWNIAPDDANVAAAFAESVSQGKMETFFEKLAPSHPQYRALAAALSRYRGIADTGGWPEVPGDSEVLLEEDKRLPLLVERLTAEGYLGGRKSPDAKAIVEAVKTYQARNGLEPDGRIGHGTLAALNVPVEERIEQIVANLERWRHMRHEMPDDYVVVNAAEQSVVVIRDGKEDLRLRTAVGTERHATPVLEATLTAVTFNPAWHVPTSIITNEILPKLDEEPSYLIDQEMEVVGGSWEDPKSLQLRQRPGARNALGFIKFEMQNQWNIYLHDTPGRSLFAKQDRFFSHGCVRVDQPQDLAQTLLTGWNANRIQQVIADGMTKSVKLEKPLPVFVLYWTVFADHEGHIHFRKDAYGRDVKVTAAFKQRGLELPPLQNIEVVEAKN